MKKNKKTQMIVLLVLYLCFLTIAFAGSIHSIEITTSFLSFYEAVVRMLFIGMEGIIIILVWKFAFVKKLHQKIKKKRR